MAWSELPMDLLEMIAKRLTTNVDYVRFRAVCMSWRSAVGGRPHHIPRQLPWLMQQYEGDSDIRCFYSLLEDKIYRINMPNSREERCCGSSQGWLAMVGKGPAIRLLNPLSRDEIQLPPITTFPGVLGFRSSEDGDKYVLEREEFCSVEYGRDIFISKIILSSNPTSDDNCIIMAFISFIYRFGKLVFCRPGDKTWTTFKGPLHSYKDFVYYKGQFLAICQFGNLYLCDVGPSPDIKQVASLPPEADVPLCFLPLEEDVHIYEEGYTNLNLVELAGELLVVVRIMKEKPTSDCKYKTVDFDIYKVPLDSRPVELVGTFEGGALFLGAINESLFVDGIFGFKKDSIYFTEDYLVGVKCKQGCHDLGIYDIVNDSIEPLPYYPNSYQQYIWSPPTWFTPSLC